MRVRGNVRGNARGKVQGEMYVARCMRQGACGTKEGWRNLDAGEVDADAGVDLVRRSRRRPPLPRGRTTATAVARTPRGGPAAHRCARNPGCGWSPSGRSHAGACTVSTAGRPTEARRPGGHPMAHRRRG
eukprot:scaffold55481_cov32-Phaeocystis_antarctica.AAC.2